MTASLADILPDPKTRVRASSRLGKPNLQRGFHTINAAREFIFSTNRNDPNPVVVVEFPAPVVNKDIYLYNRRGARSVSESIRGLQIELSPDGRNWLDYPVEPGRDFIHRGAPLRISTVHPIRCIRFSNSTPGGRVHASQITIGAPKEPGAPTPTGLFARRMGLPLSEQGTIPEIAGMKGKVLRVIDPTQSDGPGTKVDAVRLRSAGRFGNCLVQLAHVLHVARLTGARKIYLADQVAERGLLSKREGHRIDGDLTVGFDMPGAAERVLEGDFFYGALEPIYRDMPAIYALVRKWRGLMDFTAENKAFDADELAIHIRSGDVFQLDRPVHPNYGQPPLAFYTKLLKHLTPGHVHLIFEDRQNPVIEGLEAYLRQAGTAHSIHGDGLRSDIDVLLRARRVVFGRGTFVPAVMCLSDNIETAYTFGAFHNYFSDPRFDVVTVRDTGDYSDQVLNNNWQNTPQQRQLMLDYPASGLQILTGC